jgi:hypothetical protein
MAVSDADILRRRESLLHPDGLVPVGGASGWERQDEVLC